MNRIKSLLITAVLPALAVLTVSFTHEKASGSHTYLCKHQYALCTSARCIPDPGDPTKATCFCAVEEGANMSSVPCDKLQPSTDEQGIRTVYSTFSLEQFNQGLKSMKCPSGTPWTWCLNKRCTVDPMHPKQAICVCDVVRTGEWTTLGGNCDTSTCKTGYWSGTTLAGHEQANAFMTKALNLKQSPTKWCEVKTQ